MRREIFPFIIVITALLTACSLSKDVTTPEPVEPIIPTATVPPPLPTPELGLAENPLILALPPSATNPEQINAAKAIATQLTQRTGYGVVVVPSDSASFLMDALERGNAHIVLLDPLSYEAAYQRELVGAAFAVVKDDKTMYGAQFVASYRGGFISYFDPITQTNTANASIALRQFMDKKPCWTDEASPSGYIVPLGLLNKYQVVTQPAAFVQGHPTVIRSIYAGGICDFGATYIDARKFPSLEDQYPGLMEQIIVVWQIPEIIPYNVLAFSNQLPQSIREAFTTATSAILQTDDGKAQFKTAFDIDELSTVNDASFSEFHDLIQESRLNIEDLLK